MRQPDGLRSSQTTHSKEFSRNWFRSAPDPRTPPLAIAPPNPHASEIFPVRAGLCASASQSRGPNLRRKPNYRCVTGFGDALYYC